MPRVMESEEIIFQDERSEIVMEPGQEVDVLAHWKAVPLTKQGNGREGRQLYTLNGDGALVIARIATTHPDVFVTFEANYQWPPLVVGGPWAMQIANMQWIVPVRQSFYLVAQNRTARDTLREKVYVQVGIRRRRGW